MAEPERGELPARSPWLIVEAEPYERCVHHAPDAPGRCRGHADPDPACPGCCEPATAAVELITPGAVRRYPLCEAHAAGIEP